jgi:hypothetical protein
LLFSGDDNIFAAAIGASAAPNNVVRKFLLFIFYSSILSRAYLTSKRIAVASSSDVL